MKGYIFQLNLSINTVGIGTHADIKIMGLLALEYVIIEKFTNHFSDGKVFTLKTVIIWKPWCVLIAHFIRTCIWNGIASLSFILLNG